MDQKEREENRGRKKQVRIKEKRDKRKRIL
jgi:hypothetical protein